MLPDASSSSQAAGISSTAALTCADQQPRPATFSAVLVSLAPPDPEPAGANALPRGWKKGGAVGAGLHNGGNTCYVNAALQCLTYTPALAGWALSARPGPGGACDQSSCCRPCGVRAHIRRALRHPGEVIAPSQALLAGFHRGRQEDGHEFLMFTLGAMQQGCAQDSGWPGAAGPQPVDIQGVFGGRWRSRVQCLRCLAVSDTFDPYLDVVLDVGAAESVSQALQELVKPETLDGPDAYLCGSCGRKAPATKTLTLHAASRVLILVLKRFCQLSGAKLAGPVRYPEELDVSGCASESLAGPLRYVLYAVLVHTGWSCHCGHYLCYVRAADGQWYRMDDAKVSACDVSHVLSQQAYVLFYAQKAEWERGGPGREPFWVGPEGPGCGSPVIHGEHPGVASSPGPSARACAPAAAEHPESCEDESGLTLDDWRRLEEQRRPKVPLSLRKPEAALPANAVVIHGSKHGLGAPGEQPEAQKAAPETCATAAKRKARKRKKTPQVLHGVQLARGYRL